MRARTGDESNAQRAGAGGRGIWGRAQPLHERYGSLPPLWRTNCGNSSWERASSHQGTAPYARIGINPQQDIVFAEAAGTKGKVKDGSGTVEVFSASVQRGAQYEGQVTVAKVEVGTDANHIDASALTAEAHVGSYNPDGSVGYNAGVSANIVAGEAQVSREGNSVTFGLSAGFGAEVSLGERDSDDDGQTEYCARVGAGPFTVGVCIEPAAGRSRPMVRPAQDS